MTVQETAEVLKVSTVTVRRYIASRRLAAVRIGRSVRIRKEDVDRLPVEFVPSRHGRGRRTSADDPLWGIIGIASSQPDDVSENKHKYLAEAYAPKPE